MHFFALYRYHPYWNSEFTPGSKLEAYDWKVLEGSNPSGTVARVAQFSLYYLCSQRLHVQISKL